MFDFLDMTELSGFDIKFGGILPGKTGQDILRLDKTNNETNETNKTNKTNNTSKTYL